MSQSGRVAALRSWRSGEDVFNLGNVASRVHETCRDVRANQSQSEVELDVLDFMAALRQHPPHNGSIQELGHSGKARAIRMLARLTRNEEHCINVRDEYVLILFVLLVPTCCSGASSLNDRQ